MTDTVSRARPGIDLGGRISMAAVAPFIALAILFVVGAFVSESFFTYANLMNVMTRSAFIAIIAVGGTFVISAGGLDLSVGSMSAFVAALTILFMNAGMFGSGVVMIAIAMLLALGIGAGSGSMPRPSATFFASASDALRNDETIRSRIAGTVTLDNSKRKAAAMWSCSAGDWLS